MARRKLSEILREEEELTRQNRQQEREEVTKNVKWTEPDQVSSTVNLTQIFKDRYGENSTQFQNMQRQANLVNYGKENPTIWDRIKVVANETLHNAQKITGNLGYGASSGMKQSVNYLENVNEQNIPGYREKRNAQYLASTKVNDIDKAQFKTATSIFNKNDIEKPETNLIKKSITESLQEDNRKIQENIENTTDPISKKLAELAPSIGQMGVGSVLSSVNPALGIGYFTTSAGGGYIDEAKQRGMDDKQAYQYGTVMGAVEGITEAVGVENFKKAGTGIKTLVTGTGKEVGKEVTKNSIKTVLKDYGIGIADNFMQEAIIEPIQEAVATGVAGKEKADWNDIGGRMLKSGIDGALTAMITGGAELGVQSCVGVVEKINNGQQPTQQEISQSIQDAQKNGVKVENSIQQGIQQAINSQQQGKNSLQELNNINEQKYVYEKSDNKKIDDFRKNIAENTNWNNSEQTQNFTKMLEKIITDKNIDIKFNGNLTDSNGNIANGSYSNGVITINPNSTRAGEFIAIHELTHSIGTQDMLNMVQNYRENNTEFNSEVEKLLKNYKATEINEEALADISGQLFGNQEFINNIAQNNPNIFKKIYNEIKYLWHQFRGYKNQNQFVEDLYYKWTQAYNSSNELNSTTNYHISENFSNEIDKSLNGELKSNNQIKARDFTPKILVDNGVNDLPMLLTQKHLRQIVYTKQEAENLGYTVNKKDHYHGLGKETLIEAIDNLDEPSAIYKQSENNYLIVTELNDGNNNPIIVPIQINGTGTYNDVRILENQISTVYGRERLNKYIANNDFEEIYNKNRSKLNGEGVKSHDSINASTNSIPPTQRNVNDNTKYSIQESENNSGSFLMDNKGRKLSKEQQDRYKYISNELRDENGNIKNYYHGTKRADRVGNIFDPNKATSGPMAFFTDNEDIAKSYSENKQDTSLSREYDTEYDLFKANNKSLDEYWNSLSKEKQNKINQEGYNIGLDEDFENIIHEKGASKNSFSSQYEYYLKNEENNNGIKALYDVFIQDGNLMFEDMKKFEDVLKYAGIDNIQYLDPYKIDRKVYNVYLNIKNPFNTSKISSDMIDKFKEASKNAKKGESYSADEWDKSNISPEQWISRLDDDIKNGTSHAWTSIPDWVTEVLKESGYDGIVDTGGKNGGEEHQVVIPFYSEQIKSVDNTKPTDNPDIRYQKENLSWKEYLERKFPAKGTRTDLNKIKLPIKKVTEKANLPIKQEAVNKDINTKEQVLEATKQFFNEETYNDLQSNKDMFKNITEKELKEGLKQIYQVQLEDELNSNGTYKEDNSRKNTYMKYKNAETKYNESILNNALDKIKTNRNEKRTVNQWIEVAKQIGQNAGELSSKEIEQLAYGTWFDLKPNTKESITRYDNVAKTNLPFQKFTSDDWVNTIYENAKETKLKTFDETLNENKEVGLPIKYDNTKKEATLPIREEVKTTKGETIDYTQMEKPEGKIRKHYKSIIESSNTTAEAKKVAKEMMGLDTYTPQSNETLLQRADSRINNSNPDAELNSLLSKAMNSEKISDVDIAVGERLIEYYSKTGNKENLQDAIHATAMAGTQAGRATQALALLNHATPQGQVTWLQRSIDKVNNELQQKYRNKKNIPQFELTSEMTDKVLNTKSEKDMYKVLDDVYEELGKQVPKTHLEQIDEWRYFSMLANIKTHGRNLIGNLAMNKIQKAKNKVAGAIEGTVVKFNPEMERTHTLKRASKETKAFAKKDIQNMDVQAQLGMNENKYNPQSRLQNARITFKNKALNNTVGKLFDLNSNLLEAEDNIGLKSMYVSALSEYITANNIDVNKISDKDLGKARQHAIKEAQEATFHQASALATALNQMGRKNAITKFALDSAVPFKKTPINVAKTGVQYSPAGLIKSAIFDTVKLRKGNISVNQYIDNISKGLTGTGITYMGYVLAEAGLLKASGSDDDKKEQYEEEQGKQSYSIEINGKTYSLDWLSPAGVPLFIGAEINQQFNQSKKEKNSKSNDDDKTLTQAIKGVENIANATANAMNPMSEMSMVSGLTSILSSYNKENAVGNMIVNTGKSYVNQFVPTLLGQIARTGDEYERTTKSTKTGTLEKAIDQTVNQVKSKIPGLRQTLPTKTDIWGKDVKQATNLPLRAFRNFINPSTVKDVSTDKVDKELNELYSKIGENSILPKAIEKTFKINGTDYRMTDDEYAKYYKKYGETSYKLIEGFIGSSDYKNLTEQQKIKSLEKVYEYAKEKNKIDYANTNDIKVEKETTSLYNTMNELKTKVKQGEYLNYLAKTDGIEKDIEKNNILANSNYSASTKKVIYQNGTGKQDKFYNEASNREIDINEYLKYKIADSNNEFNSDKYENGKTISGSAKNKRFNWVNSNITNPNERLMILGYSYKLSNNERKNLIRYIKDTSSNEEEVIERLKLFSSNFTYNNGKIYYK